MWITGEVADGTGQGEVGAGWPAQRGPLRPPSGLTEDSPGRIQKSMLLDLNKEIMNELGVTVVGDIIAILKHAKVVHRQVGTLPSPTVPGFSMEEEEETVAEPVGGLAAKAGRPGFMVTLSKLL